MEYVERHISYKLMPNDTVTLMPIGDAQVGVEATDLRRLKTHMEWGFHTKHALFLGMGDYVDMASPSNRRTLKAAGLYDTVTDALYAKAVEDIQTFLSATGYTKGAWLGLLQGHHYMEMPNGLTSDMHIATALSAPFLGDSALVRIIFDKHKDVDGLPVKADIWCHHGRGGGASVAAPINYLEKIARGFNADIYLMGHQHKKIAAPIDEIYYSRNGRMLHNTKLLACTGSFLKGYLASSRSDGRPGGTYVEKGMMTPVSLGGIVIELGIVKEEYGDRLDLNVSL
tara:strand:- start:240 stop:1091 length:852 start_codon:yes stop_codon:yes gene_type:complete